MSAAPPSKVMQFGTGQLYLHHSQAMHAGPIVGGWCTSMIVGLSLTGGVFFSGVGLQFQEALSNPGRDLVHL